MKTRICLRGGVIVFVVATLFILTSRVALTGDFPKGKPFTAIQEQIISIEDQIKAMQDQIDAIVVGVDSLEARVTTNEGFIESLQADNALIKEWLADVAIQAEANGEQIDINSTEIQNLWSALQTNNAKIQYLQDQIDDINTTLQTKQDILDGQCADGYYLKGIDPDGTIVCAKDEMGSNGLSKTIISSTGIIDKQWDECTEYFLGLCVKSRTHYPAYSRTNYCPSGYTVTGGGFDYNHNGRDIALDVSKPSGNGWYVLLNNYGTVDLSVSSYAVCVKLVP